MLKAEVVIKDVGGLDMSIPTVHDRGIVDSRDVVWPADLVRLSNFERITVVLELPGARIILGCARQARADATGCAG